MEMIELSGEIIVVGAGFSGSVIARKIADELGLKVRVIERRPHIGGNAYDEKDEHGILVQKYGPHFIYTDEFAIIEYLSQYSELFSHCIKAMSFLDGKYIRLPFNFESVHQLIGGKKAEVLFKKLRESFKGRDRVTVFELTESLDPDISSFGNMLFDKAYRTYTSKQWGVEIDEIDKSVLERVQFAVGYDERYIYRDFQFMPKNGFVEIFENILDHPNITLELNTDALLNISLNEADGEIKYEGHNVSCLVFTGPIDELFSLKYGALPYRSLDIKYEYTEKDSVLPREVVYYPQAPAYTRKTEYRKIMFNDSGIRGSVVATEYPLEYNKNNPVGNIPYYPTLTKKSMETYDKYLEETDKYRNLFLCGRLAEFRYYDMHECIKHALEYFENIRSFLCCPPNA